MKLKTVSINSLLAVALISLLVLLSCTPVTEQPAPVPSPTPIPPPERTPDIQSISARIITEDGRLTNDVNVSVGLPGFPSMAEHDWIGDIIFYVDVSPPTDPGEPAVTAEGTYQETMGIRTVRWEDVAPGERTFSAQLVTTDMTPLDPPVIAQLLLTVPPAASEDPAIETFTVQALCSPRYRAPAAPVQDDQRGEQCADINVLPEAVNFNIVNKIGQPAVTGEGHFLYYFHVDPPTTQGEPALTEEGTYVATADSYVTWTGVVPGEYEVWVQMVNNDHTPLDPPVVAGASIIIPPDLARYSGLGLSDSGR